jgi:hypothetical protein
MEHIVEEIRYGIGIENEFFVVMEVPNEEISQKIKDKFNSTLEDSEMKLTNQPLFLATLTYPYFDIFYDNENNPEAGAKPLLDTNYFNILQSKLNNFYQLNNFYHTYTDPRSNPLNKFSSKILNNSPLDINDTTPFSERERVGADFRFNPDYDEYLHNSQNKVVMFGFEFRFVDLIPIDDVGVLLRFIFMLAEYIHTNSIEIIKRDI